MSIFYQMAAGTIFRCCRLFCFHSRCSLGYKRTSRIMMPAVTRPGSSIQSGCVKPCAFRWKLILTPVPMLPPEGSVPFFFFFFCNLIPQLDRFEFCSGRDKRYRDRSFHFTDESYRDDARDTITFGPVIVPGRSVWPGQLVGGWCSLVTGWEPFR